MFKKYWHFHVSLALHALLLILLTLGVVGGAGQESGGESQEEGSQANNQKIIPKAQKETPIELVEVDHNSDIKRKIEEEKKKAEGLKDCEGDFWFGGIGAQIIPKSYGIELAELFNGYPAKNAGLKEGDIILNHDRRSLKGEPGTPVELKVYRPSQDATFMLTLIRAKICIEQIETHKHSP